MGWVLLVLGLMALIFVGMVGTWVVRGFQMKSLANEGVVVSGEIVDKRRSGAGANSRSAPYLKYAYVGPDGQRHELRAAVAESVYAEHEIGDAFDVVCLPDKPSVAGPKYLVDLSREALKLPPL